MNTENNKPKMADPFFETLANLSNERDAIGDLIWLCLSYDGDYGNGMAYYLKKGIEMEYAYAHAIIYQQYIRGKNWLNLSDDEAMEHLKIAAEMEDDNALNHLGILHYFGERFKKDIEKAVHYFYKAAILGNENALFNLGKIMECDPDGDIDDALEDYKLGAELGSKHCANAIVEIALKRGDDELYKEFEPEIRVWKKMRHIDRNRIVD